MRSAPILIIAALASLLIACKASPCKDSSPKNEDVPENLAGLVGDLPLGDDGEVCGQKDAHGLVVRHRDTTPEALMSRYRAWLESEGFTLESEPMAGGSEWSYGRDHLRVSLSPEVGSPAGVLLWGVEVEERQVGAEEVGRELVRARGLVADHWEALVGVSQSTSCAAQVAALSEAERPRQVMWTWDLAPVAGQQVIGPEPFDCTVLRGVAAPATRIRGCMRELLEAKLWLIGTHLSLVPELQRGLDSFAAGTEAGLISLYNPATRKVECTVRYSATNSDRVEYRAGEDADAEQLRDNAGQAVRWDLFQQAEAARQAAVAKLSPDIVLR